jgi:acyl-CoA synthetase (AMP-forming)/AMP-acid ligase II
MAELLREMVAVRPHEVAVVDERGSTCWADLDRRVNRWVHVLREQGLAAGDLVAFIAGNRRETVEALLACLHTGLIVVPINWHLTAGEIVYILEDSACRGLLVDEERAGTAAEAVRRAAGGRLVRLVIGSEPRAGFAAAEPLLAAARRTVPAAQCSGSLMLYTSGTTGHPKGVVNGLLRAGAPLDRVTRLLQYLHAVLGVPERGRVLLVGPWFHSAQLFFSLFPLLSGCELVMRDRSDAAQTLALIDDERITACHLVPTQFFRLLRLAETTRMAFSGESLELIWHGGAPCPLDVKRRMIEWWGPVFTEYYGATEAGVATMIDSTAWLRKPGSVGRAVPPTTIVIVGPSGEALPPNQEGRVFVRRPPDRDFHYHNAPDKTRAAHLGPGVFTFGELGCLDEDGYLFLTGRVTDTIVSGGVNIYPAEVEAVLLTHPAVRDAVVFGVPDEEFGERTKAVVELDPAVPLPAGRVHDMLDYFCRQRLAGFKVPRSYEIVASVPREATGKARRHLLRERFWRDPGRRV